jgi:GR25 family glycosyltransferase involved in LPS biosynthesis
MRLPRQRACVRAAPPKLCLSRSLRRLLRRPPLYLLCGLFMIGSMATTAIFMSLPRGELGANMRLRKRQHPPASRSRCGYNWADANARCRKPCTLATDCATNENSSIYCFGGLSVRPCVAPLSAEELAFSELINKVRSCLVEIDQRNRTQTAQMTPGQLPVQSLRGLVDGWLYINMANRRDRGRDLEDELAELGVSRTNILRVEAVTPSHLNIVTNSSSHQSRSNTGSGHAFSSFTLSSSLSSVPFAYPGGTPNIDEWGCCLADKVETAVSISHLRAVKLAYERGWHSAIILEDDVHAGSLSSYWASTPGDIAGFPAGGVTLADVIRDLDAKGWDIAQLGMASMHDYETAWLMAKMITELEHGHRISLRNNFNLNLYQQVWGAFAYAVSRRGMRKLLDMRWPGGADGPPFESLTSDSAFDFRGTPLGVAEHILFSDATSPNATWLSTRPLFISGTETSAIHEWQLNKQARSYKVVKGILYSHAGICSSSS